MRSEPGQYTLETMATLLARRWIHHITDPQAPAQEAAAISEANRWLAHRFYPEVPSSKALDALTGAFGPDLVPDFLSEVRGGPSPVPALRSHEGERARRSGRGRSP